MVALTRKNRCAICRRPVRADAENTWDRQHPDWDLPAHWICVDEAVHKTAMPTNRGAILVNGRKAAALLDISYKQFTRLLPRLKAAGLKVVEVPSSIRGGRPTVRYVSKSIDAMIDRAARREESLC